MNPLVSVIVPIYKVEEYLDCCINSIVGQTYKNLEIILVDDGSPDNCPGICDAWAKKDARIKVIHKQNGGLSDARNAALEIACGEYITFVDSDDFITENAIELLVECAQKEKSEIIISTKVKKFSDEPDLHVSEPGKTKTISAYQALGTIFCVNTRWEAWGTLYKCHLFDNERFPKGRIYEDIDTVPRLVMKAQKCTFIDTTLYCYFERPVSIMRGNGHIVKIDLFTAINKNVLLFESIDDKKARQNAIAGILEELLSRVHFAYSDEDNNVQFIRQSIALSKKHRREILFADKISIKRKVFMFLVMFGISKKIKKW